MAAPPTKTPANASAWVRSLVALGAINGLIAVGLAAAATHAFAGRFVTRGAEWFALAGHFHAMHALALIASSWVCDRFPRSRLAPLAGIGFLLGIVLFSGALYFRALGGEGWFAHTVPMGGTLWLIAWLALALSPFI